jgi:hypothetical protein
MPGSRCSNWNNYVWNSNWNKGSRGSCDNKTLKLALINSYGFSCATNIMVRLFTQLRRIHLEVCKIVSSEISKTKDNILGLIL